MVFHLRFLCYILDGSLTAVIIIIIFITHEMSHVACSSRSQVAWCQLCPVINLKWLAVLVLTERD